MLSTDGRFSGMVPPSSLMVWRTFSPTSRWVAFALALPVIFSRRSLSFGFLVVEFLPPCLDGKIGLPLRDDFLGWVGVLNDEVTGVAGEHPLSAVDAGGAGFLDDALKVAVIYIADTKACSRAFGRGSVGACQRRWKVPAAGAVMYARIAALCSACRGITTAKGSFARAADG